VLDLALCEKLNDEFYETLAAELDSVAYRECFPPLAAELGRDPAGAIEFLRGLPMEQFDQFARLACGLIDACTGSKVEFADALYELAMERGTREHLMVYVRNGWANAAL
jgi:hypothetical protein